jgi:hypothetical protein
MLGVGAGVSVLAAVTWTTTSFADTTVIATDPNAMPTTVIATDPNAGPVVAERTHYSPPNRPLLASGLIAFGGAYIPSVIVAAANNNPYDNHLYIPVVGPWLDLGDRPPCGGVFQTSCGTETAFKTLLVISGVFQGAGAVATVLGLVMPERRSTVVAAKADRPSVHIMPAQVSRDGYGVAAFGNF